MVPCVAGKAPNEAHSRQGAEDIKIIEEGKVPRIGIDFWFMSDEEEEREDRTQSSSWLISRRSVMLHTHWRASQSVIGS